MPKNPYQLHPEFLRRYRQAWEEWVRNPNLAEACETLGMTPREWADRYVKQFGPITFTATDTVPWWSFDEAWAWEEAQRPVALSEPLR